VVFPLSREVAAADVADLAKKPEAPRYIRTGLEARRNRAG
jgi:hypothetical protein